MRIILYTGKGGVGKTSLAAATAIAAAGRGNRTIVLSTDPAHSLGDSLSLELGGVPRQIGDNLWAQEVNALQSTEIYWGKVQQYLSSLLLSQNISDLSAEELVVFPGLEELFSLLEIVNHCKADRYDTIIVDCAPTGETLRLLSFPEVLQWWLEKLFPIQKLVLKVARPVAKAVMDVPLPTDDALEGIAALVRHIREIHDLLADRAVTSVRIVVNPEKMVIKEAQRSFMYLNLYGFNTDAVIVNRLLPDADLGSYFARWSEIHSTYFEYIKNQFSPVPVLTVPLFPEEVMGLTALGKMSAACFRDTDPVGILYNGRTHKIRPAEDGDILEVVLPFVEKGAVAISQKGDELTVKVGSYKRNLYLPRKLQGRDATGARLGDGVLMVEFKKRTGRT